MVLCDPNIGTIYPIQPLFKMPHNSGAMAEQSPYQSFDKSVVLTSTTS